MLDTGVMKELHLEYRKATLIVSHSKHSVVTVYLTGWYKERHLAVSNYIVLRLNEYQFHFLSGVGVYGELVTSKTLYNL